MKLVSDKELIQKSLEGSITAFEEIIKRHQQIIASTAMNMLGNLDDAEEVGQETFIRFYNNLSQFRGDSKVSTYLVRICINLSLNRLKRTQRNNLRFVPMELARNVEALNVQGQVESKEVVHKAMLRLDLKSRAIINLRMIQELSTKQTAEILKIPEGTVLSRLKRAMDKLKKILKDQFDYE